MNRKENLYVVASEECAEIQQCISKIMRFGEMNHHPDRPEDTNARELLTEYYQLQSVMDMIMDLGVLGHMSESEIEAIKIKKRNKVSSYAELSESLGLLISDSTKETVNAEDNESLARTRGKWIVQGDKIGFAKWDACSVCGHRLQFVGSGKGMKYCPNCGAKMEQ